MSPEPTTAQTDKIATVELISALPALPRLHPQRDPAPTDRHGRRDRASLVDQTTVVAAPARR